MKTTDSLLTLDDLAEYLDIPKRTIYAWRYRGEGPIGFKLGGHVRYRRSDVEEWLNEQRDEREPAGVTRISGSIR
jgi:excisionase family DNA binding protein